MSESLTLSMFECKCVWRQFEESRQDFTGNVSESARDSLRSTGMAQIRSTPKRYPYKSTCYHHHHHQWLNSKHLQLIGQPLPPNRSITGALRRKKKNENASGFIGTTRVEFKGAERPKGGLHFEIGDRSLEISKSNCTARGRMYSSQAGIRRIRLAKKFKLTEIHRPRSLR